jgi:chromate transporter
MGMEDWLQWSCRRYLPCCDRDPASRGRNSVHRTGIVYCSNIKRQPVALQLALVLAGLPVASSSILCKLLLFILEKASLTFGSGLVIVPFLEQAGRTATWPDQEPNCWWRLRGMMSPGPVVITATFVGYLMAGFWGSLNRKVGIFLPPSCSC